MTLNLIPNASLCCRGRLWLGDDKNNAVTISYYHLNLILLSHDMLHITLNNLTHLSSPVSSKKKPKCSPTFSTTGLAGCLFHVTVNWTETFKPLDSHTEDMCWDLGTKFLIFITRMCRLNGCWKKYISTGNSFILNITFLFQLII